MTLYKIIVILSSFFPFCTVISAQTKGDIFQKNLDKVRNICNDSNYEKMVVFNSNGHSSLTGYMRNDSICLITEVYEQSYGRRECTFLFYLDKLVFVSKRQINTKKLGSLDLHVDTNAYVKFEGFYHLSNEKINDSKIIGEENESEMFDTYESYPYKKNSAEYFLFLARLDRKVLLRNKNGS